MIQKIEFDIGHCDTCDLSLRCKFTPSRSKGMSNSVLYVIASPTLTDYNKGYFEGRRNKLIKDFDTKYNFNSYYTSLVKCVTSTILFEHEIKNCSKHFKKELYIVAPKIIITIGDVVTKRFLNYNFFNEVVDKPFIIQLNNKDVIVYPIYHTAYKDRDEMIITYNKSFSNIAKLYKGFIDKNYINL